MDEIKVNILNYIEKCQSQRKLRRAEDNNKANRKGYYPQGSIYLIKGVNKENADKKFNRIKLEKSLALDSIFANQNINDNISLLDSNREIIDPDNVIRVNTFYKTQLQNHSTNTKSKPLSRSFTRHRRKKSLKNCFNISNYQNRTQVYSKGVYKNHAGNIKISFENKKKNKNKTRTLKSSGQRSTHEISHRFSKKTSVAPKQQLTQANSKKQEIFPKEFIHHGPKDYYQIRKKFKSFIEQINSETRRKRKNMVNFL
ncbi:unnamed protein product [Moneuplotes crassus]|uniref:Uncharacterized protein n=1 Tax=Euplotes crassus TaxID=5936 RepID=A0AAD2D0G1_EUPCR|nr:unnamed protein product [Moneuplotes crassus]